MHRWKEEVNKVKSDFNTFDILKSIVFGLFFSLFLFTPVVLIIINLCFIYPNNIYLLLFLLNVIIVLFFAVCSQKTFETMKYYNEESLVDFQYLLKLDIIITGSISFIIGTILILTIVPNYY